MLELKKSDANVEFPSGSLAGAEPPWAFSGDSEQAALVTEHRHTREGGGPQAEHASGYVSQHRAHCPLGVCVLARLLLSDLAVSRLSPFTL